MSVEQTNQQVILFFKRAMQNDQVLAELVESVRAVQLSSEDLFVLADEIARCWYEAKPVEKDNFGKVLAALIRAGMVDWVIDVFHSCLKLSNDVNNFILTKYFGCYTVNENLERYEIFREVIEPFLENSNWQACLEFLALEVAVKKYFVGQGGHEKKTIAQFFADVTRIVSVEEWLYGSPKKWRYEGMLPSEYLLCVLRKIYRESKNVTAIVRLLLTSNIKINIYERYSVSLAAVFFTVYNFGKVAQDFLAFIYEMSCCMENSRDLWRLISSKIADGMNLIHWVVFQIKNENLSNSVDSLGPYARLYLQTIVRILINLHAYGVSEFHMRALWQNDFGVTFLRWLNLLPDGGILYALLNRSLVPLEQYSKAFNQQSQRVVFEYITSIPNRKERILFLSRALNPDDEIGALFNIPSDTSCACFFWREASYSELINAELAKINQAKASGESVSYFSETTQLLNNKSALWWQKSTREKPVSEVVKNYGTMRFWP